MKMGIMMNMVLAVVMLTSVYYQIMGMIVIISIQINDISYVNGHYSIKVLDSYEHESEILAETIAQEFYNIPYELYNGNNLISFSAIPSDPSLSNIFFPIQDHVTGIIGPGIASSYIGDVDGDGIGDWVGVITAIDPLLGYWLKIEYGDF